MEITGELTGGNLTQVTRIGNTVHRQAGSWSPQVHTLLAHLRSNGLHEVPEPLGFDELGREILSFIPGTVAHDPSPQFRSDEILIAAARLLRRLHDASAALAPLMPYGWQLPARQPVEVICHGDFAPYNCVFDQGKLIGVFDFDYAHPGPRNWDLSYAAYRFVPLTDPSNPENSGDTAEQSRRLRIFCREYGLQNNTGFVESVIQRVAFMADYLIRGAASGDLRLQANIDAGHLKIYLVDLAYIQSHAEQFKMALD